MTTPAAQPAPGGTWYIPARSSAEGSFDTVVDPARRDDWTYTGLKVLALAPGGAETLATGDFEAMVVPLSGGCEVEIVADGTTAAYDLAGRPDVFAGATDAAYAPRRSEIRISSARGGRFAVCLARARTDHPAAYIAAEDVPVEVRGAGAMTRLVRNFGTVGVFDACDALIACEVITPGGNWSSYPAHKHDEQTDSESELEEIYYYEIAESPSGTPGFGYHQTTSTDPERPIDVLEEVRAGDVVLVPHGWHGPCAAAPGHDMYYLNVMAGPGDHRAWDITDRPDQTWVRATWEGLGPDPRLADRT
ncbi:5-deoxy-glucuronate isomerase [Brachybacterium huguangmaarense]|uniref:5-deoxy-glucuronate isomerase n=1 Tax=Brachybacterium huguangmaarense TaxID=1652028 RepID=A0ABY6G412_9MICO|nr:5-deoxy-glucuronate isomerase [Brachybacterium huguangmaarense]UYG17531.1 5-deoxy-glucuronate isomerase [Brachybacterium huguangmaarense]